MLILLVIAAAWLTVAFLVLAACRSAARGDAAMEQAAEHIRRRATLAGVVMWEQPDPVEAEDLRRSGRRNAAPERTRLLAGS